MYLIATIVGTQVFLLIRKEWVQKHRKGWAATYSTIINGGHTWKV